MSIIAPEIPPLADRISSLLLDAHDLSRNITKISLEVAGCDVSTCEDFEQALDFFSKSTSESDDVFDLVVIDSRLITKHLEILRAIRSAFKNMPRTISIIPAGRLASMPDLFEAGSNMVVASPYDPQKLINAIHRCLTKPDFETGGSRIGIGGTDPLMILRSGEEAVSPFLFHSLGPDLRLGPLL